MVSLRHRTTGPSVRGFTIIELVITVAVLAILVAIATPSFRELSLNNRATSATNNLLADLALARNEAVKMARTSYVTAAGGDWSNGWAVWVDVNGNGTRDGDGEPILREQPPIDVADMPAENQFSLTAVAGAATGSTAITRVGFGTMGQSREPDNGARFAICRPDGDEAKSRAIRVDLSGRAESVRDVSRVAMGCRG